MKENKSKLSEIQDIGLVIVSALRYALGRKTYIVPTMQNFILKYLEDPEMQKIKNIIVKDVKNYIDVWGDATKDLMQEYDINSWKNFLKKLKNENK